MGQNVLLKNSWLKKNKNILFEEMWIMFYILTFNFFLVISNLAFKLKILYWAKCVERR